MDEKAKVTDTRHVARGVQASTPSPLALPEETRQNIIRDTLVGLASVIRDHLGIELSEATKETLTSKLAEYVDKYYRETCVEGGDADHHQSMEEIYLDLHDTLKAVGIVIQGKEFTDEVGQVLSLNFIWPQSNHLDRVTGQRLDSDSKEIER